MKKVLFTLLALVAFLAPVKADNDRPIPPEQLPEAAKTFVQQYFPGNAIAYAEIEEGYMKVSYEARLQDGTKIDFFQNGEWDKVDCHYKAVPNAIVPEAIFKYVQNNFAGQAIVKIDKEHYGYEVELSNDMELKFNKEGALMYIDD